MKDGEEEPCWTLIAPPLWALEQGGHWVLWSELLRTVRKQTGGRDQGGARGQSLEGRAWPRAPTPGPSLPRPGWSTLRKGSLTPALDKRQEKGLGGGRNSEQGRARVNWKQTRKCLKPGSGLAEDRDINQGMKNSQELERNQGIGPQSHSRDKGILRRPPLPLTAPTSSFVAAPLCWACTGATA